MYLILFMKQEFSGIDVEIILYVNPDRFSVRKFEKFL